MCALRVQLTACTICAPQHRTRNPCQVSHAHGLASSAIARHYTRNHNCFLLLRVLRCFTSPRQPPHRLCIHLRVTPHNRCWVSPFGHPRINALLATPRGITQPHTSFIGSACQGIHHTPVTKHTDTQTNRYKHQNTKKKDTRVHYTVLTQHNPTHKQPQQVTRVRRAQQEQPMLPQTPNSAPTQQHFCHAKPVYPPTPHTTQHTPQPSHQHHHRSNASKLAGMPPPGKNTQRGSHTLGDSTTLAHNCGPTIKAP